MTNPGGDAGQPWNREWPQQPPAYPPQPNYPPPGYPPQGYAGQPPLPLYPSQYPAQYPPQYPVAPYRAPAPANGLAIGSLVSSLVAIPGYVLCVGFLGSIIGIVLGIVALNQIGKSGQKGKEMAIAGIVLGALGMFGMGLFSLLIGSPALWY